MLTEANGADGIPGSGTDARTFTKLSGAGAGKIQSQQIGGNQDATSSGDVW